MGSRLRHGQRRPPPAGPVAGGRVYRLDSSSDMLEQASAVEGVTWIEGDIAEWDPPQLVDVAHVLEGVDAGGGWMVPPPDLSWISSAKRPRSPWRSMRDGSGPTTGRGAFPVPPALPGGDRS